MNIRTWFCGLVLFVLSGAAHALPPRVFPAKELSESSGLPLIDDWAPAYLDTAGDMGKRWVEQSPAVVLRRNEKPLQLDCGELPVGMYYVDIDLRLDRDLAATDRAETRYHNGTEQLAQRNLPRVRPPVFLHLSVNDGPDSAVNNYRMLVNYYDSYVPTGRFFFHVNQPRRIHAEIKIGPDSLQNLRIRKITLIDFFDGIARTRAKKHPMLFTLMERERARKLEVQAVSAPQSAGLDAEARRQRDDLIWDAMPRFNTQHYLPHGGEGIHYWASTPLTLFSPANVAPELKDEPKLRNLGQWYLEGVEPESNHMKAWYAPIAPLNLIHLPSGAKYTMQQLYANEPLPQRPFRETPQGAFFPREEVPAIGRNHYIFTAGDLMSRRYLQWANALSSEEKTPGLRLPYRYHMSGDKQAARDGALMLVRWAYQWPAMQIPFQELDCAAASPELDFNTDPLQSGRMRGKLYYEGWSGTMWQDHIRAYDELFDFIDGNQELADAVHRYLPWIKTPDDVIALLDTYLLRAGMKDFREGRIGGDYSVITTAATVLETGPEVEHILDPGQADGQVYPVSGRWLDLYATAFNRDGTDYIGSWGYASIGADMLLEWARNQERLKAGGNKFQFDMTDVARFPKVAAAASSFLDAGVAGGYRLAVGDASGLPWEGRNQFLPLDYTAERAALAYRLTGDARHAWYLVNVFGRSGEDDATWSKLIQAARTVADPRLHQDSRVLGGFGAAIIERGKPFQDYRLKQAVVLRTGTGQGHVHNDALDLNYFALGCRMSTDVATRNEGPLFTDPQSLLSMMHNVVEVDGKWHPLKAQDDWPGGSFSAAEGWVETFKPLGAVAFMAGAAKSATHPDVSFFHRDVAHITVEEGKESAKPLPEVVTNTTKHPGDIVLPRSYIFDVFRVAGGRWHTWCFHGAVSDDMQLNVPLRQLGNHPAGDNAQDNMSREYLRKMHEPRVGEATDVVEATWQLSRTETKKQTRLGEIEVAPAEQNMLGVDYDEKAPRRFTRVSLLGQAGKPVLLGNAISKAYKLYLPFVYVQQRGEAKGRESVFPSIIEAYQGEPVVVSKKLLPIDENETDARRAVAVEVKTRNGDTDICFSGGRPEKIRTVAGKEKMSGELAYISRDAQGLRQATLVGGQWLQADDFSIRAALDKYAGHILAVNYGKRQVTLERALPPAAVGQEVRIFNNEHHTSYTVEAVRNEDGHAVITFTREALMARSPIEKIEADKVTLKMRPFGHEIANRSAGWTAANEANSKSWKTAVVWNNMYRFGGAPVAMEDFTDTDGDGRATVAMYDYGPGDSLELPVHVAVTRTAQGYQVLTDIPVEVKIGAKVQKLQPLTQPALIK